jgi:hypothetical protein
LHSLEVTGPEVTGPEVADPERIGRNKNITDNSAWVHAPAGFQQVS